MSELPVRRTAASPSQRRRLSVCMIVRDEAHNLAACLDTVRDVADEIIVVDTGSTDDTRRIAAQFGAVVADYAWHDDFGAARNAALARATGDWILALDADQRLDPGSVAELRSLVGTRTPALYLLRQINYAQDGASAVENPTGRLFPNHPAIRYRGRIHEQVVSASSELPLPHVPCNVLLHHYGHETGLDRTKARRYVPLIEAQAAEEPHEPFHLYNLGLAYLTLGEHEAAERALRGTLDLAFATLAPQRQPTYLLHARAALGVALVEQQRLCEAAAVCRAALALAPAFADAWCTLGAAELRRGNGREALDAYARAAACNSEGGPGRYLAMYDRNASGWKATLGMAEAHLTLGRWDEAVSRLEEVVRREPKSAELTRAVRSGLEAAPQVAGLHRVQAQLDARRGDLDAALQCLARALEIDGSDVRTLSLAAELLAKAGAGTEAQSAAQAAHALTARTSAVPRPRILFVTCLDPDRLAPMGYLQRLSLLLEAMREIGDVEIFRPTPEVRGTTAPSALVAAQAMEAASNAAAAHGALAKRRSRSLNAEAFVARRPDTFDVVFLHRLCTAWWTGWTDPRRTIVDVDDLPSRSWQQAAARGGTIARMLGRLRHVRVRRRERSLCDAFRAILVTSEEDRAYLGHPHAAVVPNAYRPHRLLRAPVDGGDGRTMIFVGTLTFPPNVAAVAWFVREVLPRVRRDVPEASLTVIGFVGPVRSGDWSWIGVPGVRFLGGVPDAGSHVHAASVSVCPLHFGRGTRIKIIEALALGTPVVSTSIGAFGLPFSESEGVLRRDDPAEFAGACVSLLRDATRRRELGEAGRAAALKCRGPEAAKAALHALVQSIVDEHGFVARPSASQ